MANTKSALKRIRTSEKRRLRNQAVKSATRTYVKKARTAITQDAAASRDELKAAISALDRAARKGVIHPNNAARRKSRLMKLFNSSLPVETVEPAAAPAPPEPEKKPARTRKPKAAATTEAKPKAAAATEDKPATRRRTKKDAAE